MEKRARFLLIVGKVCTWLTLLVPISVLIGWLSNNEILKKSVIGSSTMNPMTAVLFILLSISLLTQQRLNRNQRKWFLLVYAFVIIIGGTRLIHFTYGLPFEIDRFFFLQLLGGNNKINFMAPGAALVFILIGIEKIVRFTGRKTIPEMILIFVFTIGLFLLTGYVFKVPEFQSTIKLFPAFQTCILFLLLVAGILLLRPTEGLIGLLISDGEGSRVGRYLIGFTVIVPFTIAYGRLLIQENHPISTEMGVALVMSGYVVIFTFCLIAAMLSLNRRDQQRSLQLAEINELNEELNAINNKQQELNKELASSNEELQASSEELKSANEELHAMNERLGEAIDTIKAQDEIIINQQKEALKRSQQHLEIIFSSTEEEILLLDKDGRIVVFNNALERFIHLATGKKPEVGMYVWDMTLPERSEHSKRLFQEAIMGTRVKQEAPVTTPAGQVIHLVRYEPVFVDDEVAYVILISADITAQKRASEKLQNQFEELQKTNYELDRFVYSVSHDLRAPLATILGLVTVAEMENMGNELPYLTMIKGRINHLDRFIKNILDYSRNARTAVAFEKIDFNQLVNELKANLQQLPGFDTLSITLRVANPLPFYSDSVRLGVIISNLLTNALKFQDMRKLNHEVSIDVTVEPTEARIQVSDNGIGIGDEHQHKVFDMFYRATDRATGSGLGLYIVRETIEKLHGTIALKSVLGEFTSFDIRLPNKTDVAPF